MRLLITSSRRPSKRTRTFLKDLAFLLNADRINRGKANLSTLLSMLRNDDKLIIVDTKKGNPSRIRVYSKEGLIKKYLIRRARLLREIKKIDIKSLMPLSILVKDDFSKDFAMLFGLNTEISKSKFYIEFNKLKDKEFEDFHELIIKDGLNNIANLFLLKEWNGQRNKS